MVTTKKNYVDKFVVRNILRKDDITEKHISCT